MRRFRCEMECIRRNVMGGGVRCEIRLEGCVSLALGWGSYTSGLKSHLGVLKSYSGRW